MRPSLLALLVTTACVQDGVRFEGVGTVYHTRCSATMAAQGEIYQARCNPPACADGFVSGSINHVVVAVDPGKKVVGYAERPCLQEPRLELHADDEGQLPGAPGERRPPTE